MAVGRPNLPSLQRHHLVCDTKGRALAFVLTPGQGTDTSMVAATIPERDDRIAHGRKWRGRPIDFGDRQRKRYRGRNVVGRCFNKLKQWRGIAMRSDQLARNYHVCLCLAATLHWIASTS